MSSTPAAYLPLLNDGDCELSGGHWGLIRELVAECGQTAAQSAPLEWCLSTDNATRATGLDLLGHLAGSDDDLLPALLGHALSAAASPDEDVRWSAAVALQHKDDERTLPLLAALSADPDSDVRWQAVFGLPGRRDLPAGHPVVRALLLAMEDESDDVRDWATFALGTQSEVDSPEVRDAFVRHLDDGADTAAEAAHGLARRKDARVYPTLARWLADPDVGVDWVETAAELADPRLLPLLHALRERGWDDEEWLSDHLESAIKACATAPVRCRAPRGLYPGTVTASTKVARSAETGCRTRLRTSSRSGSRPWRSA